MHIVFITWLLNKYHIKSPSKASEAVMYSPYTGDTPSYSSIFLPPSCTSSALEDVIQQYERDWNQVLDLLLVELLSIM